MVIVVVVVESSKNERMEHCKGGESKECKEKKGQLEGLPS